MHTYTHTHTPTQGNIHAHKSVSHRPPKYTLQLVNYQYSLQKKNNNPPLSLWVSHLCTSKTFSIIVWIRESVPHTIAKFYPGVPRNLHAWSFIAIGSAGWAPNHEAVLQQTHMQRLFSIYKTVPALWPYETFPSWCFWLPPEAFLRPTPGCWCDFYTAPPSPHRAARPGLPAQQVFTLPGCSHYLYSHCSHYLYSQSIHMFIFFQVLRVRGWHSQLALGFEHPVNHIGSPQNDSHIQHLYTSSKHVTKSQVCLIDCYRMSKTKPFTNAQKHMFW